jgi:hypothetical protein
MNGRESDKEMRKCNNTRNENKTWKDEENGTQGRRKIQHKMGDRKKRERERERAMKNVDSKINK